jgi:hypothetical protein
MINDETLKYINLEYLQLTANWDFSTDMPESERQVYTHVDAEECTLDHFRDKEDMSLVRTDFRDYLEKKSKYFYNGWNGYTIICPKRNAKINMKGT